MVSILVDFLPAIFVNLNFEHTAPVQDFRDRTIMNYNETKFRKGGPYFGESIESHAS
jgi:hypothetical protein